MQNEAEKEILGKTRQGCFRFQELRDREFSYEHSHEKRYIDGSRAVSM